MSEAFIYLWYDARNKKYYLGSHKGKPTDNYAHSSAVMESFTMNTKPSYMHRKILVEGTHEEMLELESKLQTNRKERCWDRYYNDQVCDGLYYGFGSGENNPNWKDGRAVGIKHDIEARRAYEQTPERKEKEWKRQNTKEFKAADAARAKTPERKAQIKKYQQAPKYIAWRREFEQTPERKAYQKVQRAKRKTETQGVGTLVAHIK
jgi:hypothetical protein